MKPKKRSCCNLLTVWKETPLLNPALLSKRKRLCYISNIMRYYSSKFCVSNEMLPSWSVIAQWSLNRKTRLENPAWSVIAQWSLINIFKLVLLVAYYMVVANFFGQFGPVGRQFHCGRLLDRGEQVCKALLGWSKICPQWQTTIMLPIILTLFFSPCNSIFEIGLAFDEFLQHGRLLLERADE